MLYNHDDKLIDFLNVLIFFRSLHCVFKLPENRLYVCLNADGIQICVPVRPSATVMNTLVRRVGLLIHIGIGGIGWIRERTHFHMSLRNRVANPNS